MNALEPSPEHLNFGEVWEDSHLSLVLPITNHLSHDIEIKRFLKSCNCTRIEPPSLTIPAGETREVRLMLDLVPKKAEELGKAVRDFEVGILPDAPGATDVGKSIWWSIHGRVRSAIQCDPPFVDFGTVSELASPPPVQRALIKTFVPLRDLSAICSSSVLEAKAERRSMKEPDIIDLIIHPRGDLPRGVICCTVDLKPVSEDGQSLPAKQLQVIGRVVGDIQAFPPSVGFGACPLGTKVAETVVLRSLTGRPFTVIGVRSEGDGLFVKRVDEATSSDPKFEIEQKIGANGERQATVIFSIHPDGGKEVELRIVSSYCGIEVASERALAVK